MDLVELKPRLERFVAAKYEGRADASTLEVRDVRKMPGHAGFSYGFSVRGRGRGGEGLDDGWFLRLPPPGVRWRGTADVLRQVAVLRALDGTAVPHCPVRWCAEPEDVRRYENDGDLEAGELRWFGSPYFVVPRLEGDVARLDDTCFTRRLGEQARHEMARQALEALAGLHALDAAVAAPYLGEPLPQHEDVERWDRFVDRCPEPEKMRLVPEVRRRLLAQIPAEAPVGIFHGDFQWANLFYSLGGELLAVIDFELVGVGAILNDVGWFATFNDPEAWHPGRRPAGLMPSAEELVRLYGEAAAVAPDPVELHWYRALAAYKFAIITGLNLSLHRRGKRPDPVWEITALSIEPQLERANRLLGG